MKKLLFFILFVSTVVVQAQTNLYTAIRKALITHHPEIDFTDRLLAINVWSVQDENSRACNKAFDKAGKVYEHARLKGASKGMVVVLLNIDELSAEATITIKRDGIEQAISLPLSAMDVKLLQGYANAVMDDTGKILYSNLNSDKIYSSIQALITR